MMLHRRLACLSSDVKSNAQRPVYATAAQEWQFRSVALLRLFVQCDQWTEDDRCRKLQSRPVPAHSMHGGCRGFDSEVIKDVNDEMK